MQRYNVGNVNYQWKGVNYAVDTTPALTNQEDSDESSELADDYDKNPPPEDDSDVASTTDDDTITCVDTKDSPDFWRGNGKKDNKAPDSDSNEKDSDNEASDNDDAGASSDLDSSDIDNIQQLYLYNKPKKHTSISKPGSLSHVWKHEDDIKIKKQTDDEDDECIILPAGSDDSDNEQEATEVITEIPKMLEESKTASKNKTKKKKKKGDYDMTDSYIDYKVNRHGVLDHKASETLIQTRKAAVNKLLKEKSIAYQPGFEQMESVPNQNMSDRKKKKIRKEDRSKSKGKDWFNLPATEVTEEVKQDLEILQMRSVLDPKTFYKKNDLKVLPKFFQIGRVQDNAADFYHSRIPKKDRKRTLVDELLADAEFQKRSKQKFKEIVHEKKRKETRAHRHARKLKRKK